MLPLASSRTWAYFALAAIEDGDMIAVIVDGYLYDRKIMVWHVKECVKTIPS